MQSSCNQELKQIKIENWGSYLLQRLIQLYLNEELFDLSLKFHGSNDVLRVHRLIVTTCTDYFFQLEQEQMQNNEFKQKKVIKLPPDMHYECVKSIISFIYTGQLNYWSSERNNLYLVAKKMNIPVLIKLIEADPNFNSSGTESDLYTKHVIENEEAINIPTSPDNVSKKKYSYKKRKLSDSAITAIVDDLEINLDSVICEKYFNQDFNGPSRFDFPEIEDSSLGVFSSFDDITYNTKPIVQAFNEETSYKTFNVHGQEEQKSRLLKFFKNSGSHKLHNDNFLTDWDELESTSELDSIATSDGKKIDIISVKKEKLQKPIIKFTQSSSENNLFNNHKKIVREVLKKYPYLMRKNKNIKLKILKKESKNIENPSLSKRKISYVVLKSESLLSDDVEFKDCTNVCNDGEFKVDDLGPWKCLKCDLNTEYSDYHTYRVHMQDVHNEKFDPRICEYCGFKTSKRNTLMYHMYTKHDISPPKNLSFPKCQECSYVALSKSFLMKHQMHHVHSLKMNLTSIPLRKKRIISNDLHNGQILEYYRNCLDEKNGQKYSDSFDESQLNKLSTFSNEDYFSIPFYNTSNSSFEFDASTNPRELNKNYKERMLDEKENGKLLNCNYEKLNNRLEKNILIQEKPECNPEQSILIPSNERFEQSLNKYFINTSKKSDVDTIIRLQNSDNETSMEKINDQTDLKTFEVFYSNTALEKTSKKLEEKKNESRDKILHDKNYHFLKVSRDQENELEKKNLFVDSRKIIQYVEEETEIIECETYN